MSHPANEFRVMAAKIEKNDLEDFGGAMLIVPPNGGQTIEIYHLDSRKDPASFWGDVQGKVAVAVAELQDRQNNVFGVRR